MKLRALLREFTAVLFIILKKKSTKTNFKLLRKGKKVRRYHKRRKRKLNPIRNENDPA